jgi:hypothetical protein
VPRVKRSTHPPVFWPGSLIPGAEHAKAARTPYRAVWSPGSSRDLARPALRHPEMTGNGVCLQRIEVTTGIGTPQVPNRPEFFKILC